MQTEKREDVKKFLIVLADGKFHQTVPEGTEGAIVRTYEDKDGVEKTKTEIVWDEVTGKITKMSFEDGDFGKNLQLEIDEDGVISLGTASSFGEDLMKKIPAIDMSKEVKLVPYSFQDEKGKSRKGISVYQDFEGKTDKNTWTKIDSFYYDKEAKKDINGIPTPEGDTKSFDSDDWKMHFMVVRKFLIKEIENLIMGL